MIIITRTTLIMCLPQPYPNSAKSWLPEQSAADLVLGREATSHVRV